MGVHFIIGRAGSGKTRYCFDKIVTRARQDPMGPPVYWLLPRQGTFTAERELTCLSGLDAFCRVRVVSFTEFCRDVFDDCGGSSIPEVSALGRQMIIGHLLRQNHDRLRFFSSVARQPGLPAELDATFAEFERSGKTIEELGDIIDLLAEGRGPGDDLNPLLEKLHDTRLLYEAYTTYLGQDRLDQHRRLAQVQASLSTCRFLGNATIYVDGFADFTESERRILIGSAQAGADIYITLQIDPVSPVLLSATARLDEMSLFHKTERTYNLLRVALLNAQVPVDEPIRLSTIHRFTAPAIATLESSLFRDPILPQPDSTGIELLEAPDRRAEVEAVARGILGQLQGGLRLRDIGVIVRSLDGYASLIEAGFAEHGIPCFLDRRRPALHHPLPTFVRALFQIARNDWPHEAVMTMLRCGLSGVSLFDADGLENYVLAHKIRGAAGWESQSAWCFRRRMTVSEDAGELVAQEPQKAEALRQTLLAKLRPLLSILRSEQPATVRQYASEIFGTLDRFGVPQTLLSWMSAQPQGPKLEQSAEHEQVWTNFVELFDQMVDLLSDETMTPGEFYDVLESGLDQFDLALTPPTVDQVLVGQADRTRTLPLKALFVMGLNDGEFPRPPGDGSILNDRDRHALRDRLELDPGLHQRLLDERWVAYIAMTRASGQLTLSRPLADDAGRQAEPSVFWRRVLELFPNIQRTVIRFESHPAPRHVATPRQLVTSLMQWVRSSADPIAASPDSAWPALYQWLAQRSAKDDEVDRLKHRAWPALSYRNEAQLPQAIIPALFATPMDATILQLETFAQCPFKHFAGFVLGLQERDRHDVTPADLGRLYHEVLEHAFREVLKQRAQGNKTIVLETAMDALVGRLRATLRNELMLGTARNQYILHRTKMALHQFARSQRELMKRGSFRPQHIGVRFGAGGNLPAFRIDTPKGKTALLHGKIDRIDRVADPSGDAAIMDYRLGDPKLAIGMALHGLSLQLLSYLLVLKGAGQAMASEKPMAPAAAFYLPLIRKIEPVAHPDDAPTPDHPDFNLKNKPRGILDQRCLPKLDKDLIKTGGASKVVQAFIKKDGHLGKQNNSDVVASDDFRALLAKMLDKLGELADKILSGAIDVLPYKLNDQSPCSRCAYRDVCRFDPAINRYNVLKPIQREQALAEDDDE